MSIGNYVITSDFRLIGRLFDKNSHSKQIGYVIYFEKSRWVSHITYETTYNAISTYKINNIKLSENGEICCTDCDIDSLPRYVLDRGIQSIDKDIKIYILCPLRVDRVITGYKVITSTLKVLDFTVDDIQDYIKYNKIINKI